MRTVCIIQARTGSTRLPNKAGELIDGLPMLAHVLRRALLIKGVDLVVLATAPGNENARLESISAVAGALFCQPDLAENNVLGRFMNVAHLYDAQVIVRVTGDCPLLDPEVSSLVLDTFMRKCLHYAHNTRPGVDGLDTEVFSYEALDMAHHRAKTPEQREHVTPYIREFLHCLHVPVYLEHQRIKLSVDTKADLEVVRAIYARLNRTTEGYPYKTSFTDTMAAIKQATKEGVLA